MSVQGLLYVPKLNPLRFHVANLGGFWENEIPSMEYSQADVRYCQKYNVKDIFYLQFLATFDFATNATITLIDNDATVIETFTVETQGMLGTLNSYYIKDLIPSTTAGMYFIRVVVPFADGGINVYSEPIYIAEDHDDTIMITYRHTWSIHDCRFGTVNLPMFYLRVEGGLKSDGFAPAGKYTMFTDLDYQPVMLQTQPFNLYKHSFGGSLGLPNWMADKINRAFSLDYTFIDNIQYMRNEGAKMERIGDAFDPRAGWTLELLEVGNDYSERYSGGSGIIHADGVWDDDATVDDERIFSTDTIP